MRQSKLLLPFLFLWLELGLVCGLVYILCHSCTSEEFLKETIFVRNVGIHELT
jgi:hypothetical protein